jgi:hypothetical protein
MTAAGYRKLTKLYLPGDVSKLTITQVRKKTGIKFNRATIIADSADTLAFKFGRELYRKGFVIVKELRPLERRYCCIKIAFLCLNIFPCYYLVNFLVLMWN